MKIHENSISNCAMLWEHFSRVIAAYHTIMTGRFMHHCEEDKQLARLQAVAEKSVEEYMNAVRSKYFDEQNELTRILIEKTKPTLIEKIIKRGDP